MKITVIVCTYNRCQNLLKVLETLSASKFAAATEWEVLVVDNNSTDQTPEVVEEFCRLYPARFRYLFEPRQGKSYALNAGIRKAGGDVLVFTDDDVTVEPDWLWNLTSALHSGEWAGAGGRTLPAQPFSPPDWLAIDERFTWGGIVGGLFDLGDKPLELSLPPYGVNMAFRKKMFEKYGEFRTDLGPSASRDVPRPNEDAEFGRRLMAAGEKLLYEPSAVVYHPVLKNRMRKEYFLAWWFDYGRALIREKKRRPPLWGIPRAYFGIPKMIGIRLAERSFRWMCTFNPQRRFSRKCHVWVMAGQIVESYHAHSWLK